MKIQFNVIGEEFEWTWSGQNWAQVGPSYKAYSRIRESQAYKVVDTETTGLNYFLHKVFSVGFKVDGVIYYANLKDYKDLEPKFFEDDFVIKNWGPLRSVLETPSTWVGHNIKFDWHMIKHTLGVKLSGVLWDTMVIERVLSNDEFSYSLANCVKRNVPGFEKDDAVENYIEERGLYQLQTVTGKKKAFKDKYYYMVPFHIIAPYAAADVDVTERLYLDQQKRILEYEQKNVKFGPKLRSLIETEINLLPACCEIEERGVLVDRDFCEKGLAYEESRQKEVERWFEETHGSKFVDSVSALSPLFEKMGLPLGKTEAGNDSISEVVLGGVDHELPKRILNHREAAKRKDTYFQSFLNLSRGDGALHPDMKQAGTRTGRFSYSDPNLQNIPAEDESPLPIRRGLTPRPGHFFFMPDYNQMEFRMMLDYAGEMDLIEKILGGHDPHQATADITGLTRKAAKTLNFGLLYGMGIEKLGKAIGVSYDEAKAFKAQYFAKLPAVKRLIYGTSDVAKARGFVYTWAGRKLDFKNPDFAYKAVNGIIQGGCADVVKIVMVNLAKYLRDLETCIIMQVHDELLFEMPFDEVGHIGMIKEAMENVYPHRFLPLTVGLSYSLDSFHDGIEAKTPEDIYTAIGAKSQGQGSKILTHVAEHLVH